MRRGRKDAPASHNNSPGRALSLSPRRRRPKFLRGMKSNRKAHLKGPKGKVLLRSLHRNPPKGAGAGVGAGAGAGAGVGRAAPVARNRRSRPGQLKLRGAQGRTARSRSLPALSVEDRRRLRPRAAHATSPRALGGPSSSMEAVRGLHRSRV